MSELNEEDIKALMFLQAGICRLSANDTLTIIKLIKENAALKSRVQELESKNKQIEQSYAYEKLHDVAHINELDNQLADAMEIVKAVAHIGIEFEDYGKFEIGEYHILRARDICNPITPPKGK